MGISQVPPVPTPTNKGDIVVGTATGPARLPVGTTANQALLVDSTTATGLKYGSTSLTTTLRVPNQPTTVNITGFTYANPNVTVTTSAPHNFQVNNTISIAGVLHAGATANINSTQTISAVPSATQFTFNIGATAPSAYTSGGQVTIYFSSGSQANGGKYFSNGVYFLSAGCCYFYSSDGGVTWNSGQVPSNGNPITSADFDGTTYVVSCATSGIYTSPSLAQGSWTQRSAFGGFYCHAVKWCAGSVNRWVAMGSNTSGYNGAGSRVETATTATGSWTSQTITGTNGSATYSMAFDGSNTILGFTEGSGPLVSTSGASSWAITTNANSYYNLATNQGFGWVDSWDFGFWNSVNSRWYGFVGYSGQVYGLGSTSGAPNTFWQRASAQHFPIYATYASNAPWMNADYLNVLVPDFANNRFFCAMISGGVFNVITYSATPTVIDNTKEFFPITGVASAPGMLPQVRNSSHSGTTLNWNNYGLVYGNGKWIILHPSGSQYYASSYLIAVVE